MTYFDDTCAGTPADLRKQAEAPMAQQRVHVTLRRPRTLRWWCYLPEVGSKFIYKNELVLRGASVNSDDYTVEFLFLGYKLGGIIW